MSVIGNPKQDSSCSDTTHMEIVLKVVLAIGPNGS